MAKTSKRELIRQALNYAIQDREGYADAWAPGTPERQEARETAREFRALLMKDYGERHFQDLPEGKSTSIFDLKPNAVFGVPTAKTSDAK